MKQSLLRFPVPRRSSLRAESFRLCAPAQPGISTAPTIGEKLKRWAETTEADAVVLLACLDQLAMASPEEVATDVLGECGARVVAEECDSGRTGASPLEKTQSIAEAHSFVD